MVFCVRSEDPFAYTGEESLKRQESWKILQQKQQARLREHREESTSSRPGPAVEAEKDNEEEQVIYVILFPCLTVVLSPVHKHYSEVERIGKKLYINIRSNM